MDDVDETITLKRRDWEAVLDRLDLLEAERVPGRSGEAAPADAPTASDAPRRAAPARGERDARVTRRRALAGLAGAAAAGVAAVAVAEPAAAADGSNIVIGSEANTGSSETSLAVTGTTSEFGLAVVDNSALPVVLPSTLLAQAKGQNFDVAVTAQATGPNTGLLAISESGQALFASSSSGIGAVITTGSTSSQALYLDEDGGPGALRIKARDHHIDLRTTNATLPPNRSSITTTRGVVSAAQDGSLWYCIAEGTPGTWRKLSGAGTAGSLHLLPAPARVYDSRPGTQPAIGSKTPLVPNTARVLDVKVNGSGVPAGATGVVLTVLLVNAAAGNGNLTVWANGVARPAANTMVWGPSGGRFTATALTAISGGGGIQVVSSLATDLVIDVVGYYR